MSPTATEDVARVVMRTLMDGCAPGIYHVVNAGLATWYEFACEIVRRAGVAAECHALRFRGIPGASASSALQRARRRQGLGGIRRLADVAGGVGALPARH